MKEVLKGFKHLAREIIIYIIPGFLFIFDILLLLKINHIAIIENKLFLDNLFIITIVIAYILGHLAISFRELIMQLLGIIKSPKEEKCEQLDKELEIYKIDIDRYEGFIERYNLLYAFRKNITWVNIILLLINTLCAVFVLQNTSFYIITMIINLIFILFFGFNTYNTNKEYKIRINKIWKLIEKDKIQ